MYFNNFIKLAGPVIFLLAQAHATPIQENEEASSARLIERTPRHKPSLPKVTTSTPIGGYWGTNLIIKIANIDFNMLFDTGSSDLLLCGIPGVGNPIHTYPLTDEQKKSKKTFVIEYDDGTEDRGVEVEETVTIGGVSTKMWIAVSTTCQMGNWTDGILGASNYQHPIPQVPTLMQALATQLKQPSFAMSIASENASLVIGEPPDNSKYVNDLKTVTTVSKDMSWGLPNVTFTIGKTSMTGPMSLDTGTSWTELPRTLVEAWHQQIPGTRQDQNGAWFIPCNTSMFPDLTFNVPDNPGYTHIIPGSPLLGSPLDFDPRMCDSFLVAETHQMWFPGWAFFSTHYTWFDFQSGAVSFARQPSPMRMLSSKDRIHHSNSTIARSAVPPSKKVVSS